MVSELRTSVGVLAAKVVTTYHVNWLSRDAGQLGLEDVFKLAYGKPMEMLESPNDTDYAVTVTKEPLGEYDLSSIKECVDSGSFEYYYLRLLMQNLAIKNVIPVGEYVVTMSW